MSRDPWRSIWRVATSKATLLVLLGALAVSLVLAAWFPQIPAASGVLYAQRLSEANLRFGGAADALQRLGLLSITRSVGFRLLLALLGACLIVRTVDSVESLWTERAPKGDGEAASVAARLQRLPKANLGAVCTSVGGLFILAGLLLNVIWGWQEDGITLQDDGQTPLSYGTAWVAWAPGTERTSHSPGIRTTIQATGPGFIVQAFDDTGQPLHLQQSPTSPPMTELKLALTEDRYFAAPEAGLVVRLSANRDPTAVDDAPVSVQVYGSPSGQLVVEAGVTGNAVLIGDNVTLQFTSAPYAQVSARFAPGRWPASVGILLLIGGGLVCSVSKFRGMRSTSRSLSG